MALVVGLGKGLLLVMLVQKWVVGIELGGWMWDCCGAGGWLCGRGVAIGLWGCCEAGEGLPCAEVGWGAVCGVGCGSVGLL